MNQPANGDVLPIGERIYKRRRELGLTQDAFARLVGVAPMTVSRWERGASIPEDRETLTSLADNGVQVVDSDYRPLTLADRVAELEADRHRGLERIAQLEAAIAILRKQRLTPSDPEQAAEIEEMRRGDPPNLDRGNPSGRRDASA